MMAGCDPTIKNKVRECVYIKVGINNKYRACVSYLSVPSLSPHLRTRPFPLTPPPPYPSLSPLTLTFVPLPFHLPLTSVTFPFPLPLTSVPFLFLFSPCPSLTPYLRTLLVSPPLRSFPFYLTPKLRTPPFPPPQYISSYLSQYTSHYSRYNRYIYFPLLFIVYKINNFVYKFYTFSMLHNHKQALIRLHL